MEQPYVRPDQVLDRVEHVRRVHDLVDPGKEKMRLEIVTPRHLAAFGTLERFQPVAPTARLFSRETVDRASGLPWCRARDGRKRIDDHADEGFGTDSA